MIIDAGQLQEEIDIWTIDEHREEEKGAHLVARVSLDLEGWLHSVAAAPVLYVQRKWSGGIAWQSRSEPSQKRCV